ncbi:hypothetical protein [Hyphomicrobium sp. DY-1]|uniref:hypothetical protein n=1 Tax=Hyphomicrobium sp. DY-1 TaxID=3075650 RepID=UPI0039C0F3B2
MRSSSLLIALSGSDFQPAKFETRWIGKLPSIVMTSPSSEPDVRMIVPVSLPTLVTP